MNQSDLRVDGLPNVAAVWVYYFLLMIAKRQQTVSDAMTNNGKLGRHTQLKLQYLQKVLRHCTQFGRQGYI